MDIELISSELDTHGFYLLENPSMIEIITKARLEYLQLFHQLLIHSSSEKFSQCDLLEKPWRKLAIGASNGLKEPYAQFLQTTYFHEQCRAYPYLKQLFSYMIRLRNRLLNVSEDFGSCPERDLFWNACRVHHYPSGGGFMMAHKDTHFPKVLETSGFPFLQIMIPLAIRGEDFITGGGFIVPKSTEQKYYFETPEHYGKIVLFDGGHVIHGVDDVDGDQIVDFQAKTGRFAAFVNVYQVR